jgi:hypothetical protein
LGRDALGTLKIIVEASVTIVLLVTIFLGITVFDVAGYTATNSQTLEDKGSSVGKALVIYDPGLSGSATSFANKVAFNLQSKNYTVTLAGVKTSEAQNVGSYNIIVVGGPIYLGGVTSSIKYALDNLHPDKGTSVGVFGVGASVSSLEDLAKMKSSAPTLESGGALSKAIVMKIGNSDDFNATAIDFVNKLVSP